VRVAVNETEQTMYTDVTVTPINHVTMNALSAILYLETFAVVRLK